MSDWDKIREAISKLENASIKNEQRSFCHPYQYYEAIKRGIITKKGKARKGRSIYEVFMIPIPPPNKVQ